MNPFIYEENEGQSFVGYLEIEQEEGRFDVVLDPFPYNFTDSFVNEEGHDKATLSVLKSVFERH